MSERCRMTSVRYIPLTCGRYAIVDAEDYEWLVAFSEWRYYTEPRRITGYARSSRSGAVRMHRIIMQLPSSVRVDHRNGNGVDNRRCNLRVATNSQNLANRGPTKVNTTGYKGVSRKRSKFITFVGGRYIGTYDAAEDAARAYNTVAIAVYGEFACLNPV